MRRRPAPRRALLPALLVALLALVACGSSSAAPGADSSAAYPAAPRSFFGVVPQSILSDEDSEYMRAARIGTVRIPIGWSEVQPDRRGEFDWESPDREIANLTRHGIRVLPFLASTPGWVAGRTTTLPIDNPRARRAWMAFLRAAVARYGPGGDFWAEKAPGAVEPGEKPIFRPLPIRDWQIWNEANFFYFAYPVSPGRYARLLRISNRAVKAADPRGRIILSGLFGEPDQRGKRGMYATRFLDRLYTVPGIRRLFDGIALHPYAYKVPDMERMVEGLRRVAVRNGDRRVRMYITEMGWGSDYNPEEVAFEQGILGQARELRGAYRYMLENRRRLNLQAAYWFTWKDSKYYCSFCDSVGFFPEGDRYRPKPAWRSFVRITRGRPRPPVRLLGPATRDRLPSE